MLDHIMWVMTLQWHPNKNVHRNYFVLWNYACAWFGRPRATLLVVGSFRAWACERFTDSMTHLCVETTHVRLPEGTLNTLNYPIDYCYVDYLSNLLINGVSDIMLPLFRVTLHQMHWEISKICRFVRPPTPLRHRKDEEKQLDELMFVTRRSYDPCCWFRWLLLLHFKVLYAHAERMGKPCSRWDVYGAMGIVEWLHLRTCIGFLCCFMSPLLFASPGI